MLFDQDRFAFCLQGFEHCLDEALRVANQCSRTEKTSSAILRGSLLLGVSAFDFLIHELARVEIMTRASNGIVLEGFDVPVSILTRSADQRLSEIELHIRKKNSYRAFVAPQNVKEALKPVIPNIWKALAENSEFEETETKDRLEKVWLWRNRIAHEGDYVPSNANFEKWPIYKADVADALSFLRQLGIGLTNVLACRGI